MPLYAQDITRGVLSGGPRSKARYVRPIVYNYTIKLREEGETKPTSVHGRCPARPGIRYVVRTTLIKHSWYCNTTTTQHSPCSAHTFPDTSYRSIRLTSRHTSQVRRPAYSGSISCLHPALSTRSKPRINPHEPHCCVTLGEKVKPNVAYSVQNSLTLQVGAF